MIDRGLRVEPHTVTGWWKDTGKLEDMLEANRLILSTIERDVRGDARRHHHRGRRSASGEGSVLERCTVRGPAIIGADCRLTDPSSARTRPSATAWSVEEAEIEHSIILENSRICRLGARMADSLIGRDCVIAHSDAACPSPTASWWATPAQIGIL